MGLFLNKGNAGFRSIRKQAYVDKSGLISFINTTIGTKSKLTCVSRPRRFGKSFATQMLCAYYDKSCDSRSLFEDLEIAKDPSFEKYLNKYDVIYLDMTWFISFTSDINHIVDNIKKKISEDIYSAYPMVEKKDTFSELLYAVCNLTGNKFIFIIDEWDALFREAKEDEKLQKEYIYLLRGLFKSPCTDDTIEAAYITGILPIKKYGTQSSMTDFTEYSMLSAGPLEKYVGFTEEEVKILCKQHEMDFEEMKRWYDGYSFRKIKSVYNPNSVMKAVTNEVFDSYWTKTETYSSLKIYIEMDFDGLKATIVQMIGGAHSPVKTIKFQNDLTSIQSRDDVLTLLIHLGYLGYDAAEKTVYIPNEEIRLEFLAAVEDGRHKEVAKLIHTSDQLLRATLRMDAEAVADAIEAAHTEGTAPLFYNNEQALRSIIRFAYISCMDEYLKIEELPTGNGYADVVYLPKRGSSLPVMIIELKWNRAVDTALEQIEQRHYPKNLEGYGGEMLLVGISYDDKSKKHTCVIKKHMKR